MSEPVANASAEPAADSEIVILSPFTVSDKQTHGYQAANSIGATRSNTPIKDVPLNIQVFTKDMAQDIVATLPRVGYRLSVPVTRSRPVCARWLPPHRRVTVRATGRSTPMAL